MKKELAAVQRLLWWVLIQQSCDAIARHNEHIVVMHQLTGHWSFWW